jgi:hypothetical protein
MSEGGCNFAKDRIEWQRQEKDKNGVENESEKPAGEAGLVRMGLVFGKGEDFSL